MHEPTAHELVARGAELLDEKLPGWADVIDLERLWMEHGCHCVLGQIGTEMFNLDRSWHSTSMTPSPYTAMETQLDSGWLAHFGFLDGFATYDELQDAWKGEIVARRTL